MRYWGTFVDCREWELATPDAFDEIFDFTNWQYEHNCRFNGNVVNTAMLDSIIKNEHYKREPKLKVKNTEDYNDVLNGVVRPHYTKITLSCDLVTADETEKYIWRLGDEF
ncbi:hypothetical protein L4C34_18315 [Vibrio profundum]|uniref:hypothetical protein n=1 Tax=Vibrio profundum TaxID=2910247 RepID=UPI003D14BF7E